MLIPLVLSLQFAAALDCRPIPGTTELWTKPGLRYVLVGENHGTREGPAIFADLVCAAIRESNRPIVVALEMNEQAPIDAYFRASGQGSSEKVLLDTVEWRSPNPDGRTSRAMLDLFRRLAEFRKIHDQRIRAVAAISVSRMIAEPGESFETPEGAMRIAAGGERRMAEVLLNQGAASPDALVIALAGNFHAAKSRGRQGVVPYEPMGFYLPPGETLAIGIEDRGGYSWNCSAESCGVFASKPTGKRARRSVMLDSSLHPDGYDGRLNLGSRTRASLPANGQKPGKLQTGSLVIKN